MEKKNLSGNPTLKIALAGSVNSSFYALKKLVAHEMNVAAVFGYEPENPAAVSGYANMRGYCKEQGIPYSPFVRISDDCVKESLAALRPDLFFVVGLSQLVPEDLLAMAKLGNVGFHPTCLPKGRGRAPIAWLILEEKKGASTFFLMGKGADDGPVLVQKEFAVEAEDDAMAISEKIHNAMEDALDDWLPKLKEGYWNPIPQEEEMASYYGRRNPEDGWINWSLDAEQITGLIRATTHPLPGAYTFLNGRMITVLKAQKEDAYPIKGVIGRVLVAEANKYLVQTGKGLVWISGLLAEDGKPVSLRVGQRLGYYSELEIYMLNKEIQSIKKRIGL
jgi:methionyl-tRNA formyltransferase